MDAATRKFKRIKVDIRVRMRRADAPEAESSVVRTYELSVGGMSVYATEALKLGSVVRIELTFPGIAERFEVMAMVRNRRGFRLGMEFVDLADRVKAEIQRYLEAEAGVVEI
jgi:c-di-GMP-binding flagellar brake protein YcgR